MILSSAISCGGPFSYVMQCIWLSMPKSSHYAYVNCQGSKAQVFFETSMQFFSFFEESQLFGL